jgi:hypothetical protein
MECSNVRKLENCSPQPSSELAKASGFGGWLLFPLPGGCFEPPAVAGLFSLIFNGFPIQDDKQAVDFSVPAAQKWGGPEL